MGREAFCWCPVVLGLLCLGGCGGTVNHGGSQTGGESGGAGIGGRSSGGTGGTALGGRSSGGSGGSAIGGQSAGGSGGTTQRPPAEHRTTASSCVGVHNPPDPSDIYDPTGSDCTEHADCTEGENGKCVAGIGMAGDYFSCTYDECQTDADCDPGKVCYCTASDAARCFSVGNCRTDADCGAGNYCSPSMSWDCGGYRPIDGYHCHTPQDTCIDDADCTGDDYCNFNVYENHWECTAPDNSCAIG